MIKIKISVRDSKRANEKRITITGPKKTVLVKLAFPGGGRASTTWLTWHDDVGHVLDELHSAGYGLADKLGEDVRLEIDSRYSLDTEATG